MQYIFTKYPEANFCGQYTNTQHTYSFPTNGFLNYKG